MCGLTGKWLPAEVEASTRLLAYAQTACWHLSCYNLLTGDACVDWSEASDCWLG